MIRTFVAWKPSKDLTKKEWKLCVDGLREITNRIKDEKIYFALETHNNQPIAVNEEDYKRLEKVIKKGNIEVGLMLTVRFMSSIYTIKQIIERGEIGQLLGVKIFSPQRLRAEERLDWPLSLIKKLKKLN